MKPHTKKLLSDALILIGILLILTLLANGQIAASVLIIMPMVFLIFGSRKQE
ncbi:MAG: hypothetical protein U9Q81_21525 [Pseudomonadota bacterium]|nr:hypothetical protein [Pseudomonadota bacterium]